MLCRCSSHWHQCSESQLSQSLSASPEQINGKQDSISRTLDKPYNRSHQNYNTSPLQRQQHNCTYYCPLIWYQRHSEASHSMLKLQSHSQWRLTGTILCVILILTPFHSEKYLANVSTQAQRVSIILSRRHANGPNYATVCPIVTYLWRHLQSALLTWQTSDKLFT